MDSLGIKLPPSMASRSRVLRDPVAVREAAETELGPAKAVSPTSDSGAGNRKQPRHEESLARDIIDPKNAEALLRAAEHHPDAAGAASNQVLLRERAYHNAVRTKQRDGKAPDSASDAHADIQA